MTKSHHIRTHGDVTLRCQ